MNKIVLIVFLSLTTLASISQTNVPAGNVNGNWTSAYSPYLIQGDISIQDGDSLQIDSGVRIEFQGRYKLLVLGRLLAYGTDSDSIVFTATDTTLGWNGIRFENTPTTNDSSKIFYCKIEYGKATGAPDTKGGGLYFFNVSKAVVSYSSIMHCVANSFGGGIYCEKGSPTFNDNDISFNRAALTGIGGGGGGGIALVTSNSSLYYNTISHNSSNPNGITGSYGGGIYCVANCTFSNNRISDNYAGSEGGGIYCGTGTPHILGDSILNNKSTDGGGISCNQSTIEILDNLIDGNTSTNHGGGLYCVASSTVISRNLISNNTANAFSGGIELLNNGSGAVSENLISNNHATNDGGGISLWAGSTNEVYNNVIVNNTALENGGGVLFWDSNNSNFYNNTVANNSAQNGGGIACQSSASPTLKNILLWGNTASVSGNQVYLWDNLSDPIFNYCDVQSGSANFGLNTGVFYSGSYLNNMDLDPMFVAPSSGSGSLYNGISADWDLHTGSPCIDQGDVAGPYPLTDYEGHPRIYANRIDIGAYEFQGTVGVPENNSQGEFYIYPNPTQNLFTFRNYKTLNETNIHLQIFDNIGKCVYDQMVMYTEEIGIEKFSPGLYIVKFTIDGKNYCQRLIVQNY